MNLRPFEIGLIGFFVIAAFAGLIMLSAFKGGSDEIQTYGSRVLIWGTFDKEAMTDLLMSITDTDKAFGVVQYEEIEEEGFESRLLNAIAEGNSPDLVLIPHTLLVTYRSKLTSIPYESLDVRTLRNTYIDGVEVFSRPDGTYALPFAVDPLVLYWNRDLFSAAGLAEPPKTWESLIAQAVPALTKIDAGREIETGGIGLGEYENVLHAQKILSMLFFQAGATIVEEQNENYVITLNRGTANGIPPARAAINFYTQFADPGAAAYTWSSLKQLDHDSFTGGTLAMYMGLGSEVKSLEDENPNLSFDMATVPQAEGATALRNYGTFYGFAIPKASKNVSGAYAAANVLTQSNNAGVLSGKLGLTPVHRSLYSGTSPTTYGEVLEAAALIARGWLSPSPEDTEEVFRTMIQNAQRTTELQEVISDAVYTLETLYR